MGNGKIWLKNWESKTASESQLRKKRNGQVLSILRVFNLHWNCNNLNILYLNTFKIINPFITEKIEKLDFWDANNFTNFKHQ